VLILGSFCVYHLPFWRHWTNSTKTPYVQIVKKKKLKILLAGTLRQYLNTPRAVEKSVVFTELHNEFPNKLLGPVCQALIATGSAPFPLAHPQARACVPADSVWSRPFSQQALSGNFFTVIRLCLARSPQSADSGLSCLPSLQALFCHGLLSLCALFWHFSSVSRPCFVRSPKTAGSFLSCPPSMQAPSSLVGFSQHALYCHVFSVSRRCVVIIRIQQPLSCHVASFNRLCLVTSPQSVGSVLSRLLRQQALSCHVQGTDFLVTFYEDETKFVFLTHILTIFVLTLYKQFHYIKN
jgi:hypothetical protein